jgi:hypothetical protein
MTMNDHWGYNKNDKNFKSAEALIWNLVDCAAKGGNYLLNVGPTAEGLIPGESVERMYEIGNWMKVNSSAIYKSKAWSHFEDNENIRYITDDKGNVNVFVRGWPGEKLILKKIKPAKGSKIKLLGTNEAFNWTSTENGIEILLPLKYGTPGNRPCNYVYVFRLKGKPQPVSLPPMIGNADEQKTGSRIFSKETTITLATPETGASVYYTIDGTEPDKNARLYSAPITITKSCELKAISITEGKVSSNTATFSLSKAKYEITLLSEVSPKYSASGPKTIVDGRNGSGKFTDGKWLGFDGNDFEAVIDLGSVQPISEVSASFLQSHNSWIFLPLSVEVYTSDDNRNFAPAGVTFGSIPKGYESDQQATYSVKTNRAARYIRIRAKSTGICPAWHKGSSDKAWLFVDEINVK